jgi:biotin transport system substrate-specific component
MEGRERITAKEGVWSADMMLARGLWLVPLLALLTAAGALVRVPVPGTPVPATMQTFCVLIAGGVGGTAIGFLSQALYISLGLAGVPFFAGGLASAWPALPPTFGYLIGFAAAAALMGAGKARGEGMLRLVLRGAACIALVYACGAGYLMLATWSDAATALTMGVFPFVAWDLLKVLLAAFAIRKFRATRAR